MKRFAIVLFICLTFFALTNAGQRNIAYERGENIFVADLDGTHAKKIAERLGHSSIKLTMDTYGHLFEGSDRESAEQMERLFGSASGEKHEPAPQNNVIVMKKRIRANVHADKNADTSTGSAS